MPLTKIILLMFFLFTLSSLAPLFNQIQEIQYHFLELRDDLLLFTMSYFVSFCSQFNVVLIKGNCEYTVCLKHFIKPFSCLHLTFEGLLSYLKAVNDNSIKSWSQGMNVYVRCNSIATHLSSGKYISKMLLLRMFLIYPIINCF